MSKTKLKSTIIIISSYYYFFTFEVTKMVKKNSKEINIWIFFIRSIQGGG